MFSQSSSPTVSPGSGLHRTLWALIALALFAVVAVLAPGGAASSAPKSSDVVVANRGSGDISIIDTRTLAVSTVALPGDGQPMYVNHDQKNDRVIVGDRNTSTLVAFDDETYEVVGSVEVGAGVFHQWVDDRLGQVWVVGNESDSVTAVDLDNLSVLATITMPADLTAAGGEPHDVFVKGSFAYVSILGLNDGSGAVVQYSTRTFAEVGRISVDDDPHLFVNAGKLYVASQAGNSIGVYHAGSLRMIDEYMVPAAHGIFVSSRSGVLGTNISGGGFDAVWALDGRLRRTSDQVTTSVAIPHNLTIDTSDQVFVTHSGGAANQVSVIQLSRRGQFGEPQTVTVGTNPFGLAFIR